MNEAFIYDAVRTPRGKGRRDGALHEVTAVQMSACMLDAIRERNRLAPDSVADVIWGNVTQVGEQGGCLARSAVLMSEFDEAVPGLAINRFCASGLEAVNLAASKIRGGMAEAVVAGGVEMMSRVPMGSDGIALMVDPALAMANRIVPQGISADLIATLYGFSREDCDRYAVESHRRACHAWRERRFRDTIVPVVDVNDLPVLEADEIPREDSSLESLAGLQPSFADLGQGPAGFDQVAMLRYPEIERINHVHHAGNSSAIVDGAAAVLVGTSEFGNRFSLSPRARILSTVSVGSEPTIMLTGPAAATKMALDAAGIAAADVDVFEVNEAFASVVLRFMQVMDVPWERVNINGGAIAMGHPLGATGAMLLGTAIDEMQRIDGRYGLITLCVAGGMGTATVVERI